MFFLSIKSTLICILSYHIKLSCIPSLPCNKAHRSYGKYAEYALSHAKIKTHEEEDYNSQNILGCNISIHFFIGSLLYYLSVLLLT